MPELQSTPRFTIEFLAEARQFLKTLSDETKQDIVTDLKTATLTVNNKFFKKLKNTDIWEFRSKSNNMQYRLLAFWDKTRKSMIIATHGFIKKTQKTPKDEIKKAEKLMKEYYNNKRR